MQAQAVGATSTCSTQGRHVRLEDMHCRWKLRKTNIVNKAVT